MMQCQTGFDESRQRSGGTGMADLATNRSECDRDRSRLRLQQRRQRFGFRAVIPRSAGAGDFEVLHRGRVDHRVRAGADQGRRIRGGVRVQRFGGAAACRAHPANHRVNPVAVAHRVREPFQHDCCRAFARQHAVRRRLQRTRCASC